MKILKNHSPLLSRRLLCAPRPHGRRGFSLIEMVAVVAIIGMIIAIGSSSISKAWKRQKLQSAAGDIRVLFQRAYSEVQRRGIPVFVQVGPLVTSGAAQYLPIYLVGDANQNAALDGFARTPTVALPDLLIDEYDIVVTGATGIKGISGVTQDFCLSEDGTSLIKSTLWSDNATAWTAPRALMCDFQGRTVSLALVAGKLVSTGQQIVAPATLVFTHSDVVSGSFQPPTRFMLNINPVWSVRAIKQIKDPSNVWVNENG